MRTINLNEDEVYTLFRLLYNQTEDLQHKIDYFRRSDKNMIADSYQSELNILDAIGKKVMHSRPEMIIDAKLKMKEDEADNY